MRRPLIGGEDFQASIEQGEQAQRGLMGSLPRGWMVCIFFEPKETKEKKECVKKNINFYE
jgi:hypothetical protein